MESTTTLPMIPVFEMTWEGWTRLHPDSRVPAHLPAADQLFGIYQYPYGNYEESEFIFFPVSHADERRPPKERLLGIPAGTTSIPEAPGPQQAPVGESLAFPFAELDRLGPTAAVHEEVGGQPVVIFWKRDWQGAAAFHPRLDGETLTFVASGDEIRDQETGSLWTLDGRAVEGPFTGRRLTAVVEAYVAFWFAWGAFHPESRLWTAEAGA